MMLIFTYHKVRSLTGAERGEFYTIPPERLRAQLQLLASDAFRCLDIGELLGGTTRSRSCVLTFDDGTVDHYDVVAPMLEEQNCRGIFFVPTAKLNKPGRLTDAQVRELAARGHTIGCHSHEHERMDVLSDAEIRQQLNLSRQAIADLTGKPPGIFAPPGGYFDGRVCRIALETGLNAIRTMRWGYNRRLRLDCLDCVPVTPYLTGRQLQFILEGRRLWVFKSAHQGKQLLKALLPIKGYERLRARLLNRVEVTD